LKTYQWLASTLGTKRDCATFYYSYNWFVVVVGAAATAVSKVGRLQGDLGMMKLFSWAPRSQGCQMVYFQIKNRNLGKFWRVLQWKMLVYFIDIWSILRPFYTYNGHLVYFVVIWYIFSILLYCTKKNLATLTSLGSYIGGVFHTKIIFLVIGL
jgi:hypothetical protein